MKRILRTKILSILISFTLMGSVVAACVGSRNSSGETVASGGKTVTSSCAAPQDGELVPTITRQTELKTAEDKNSATVAWLYLPGTEIDDPVLQSTDNEYYLNRDESGNYAAWGCYFADYMNDLSSLKALNTNTVIYGHSYKTESPDERKFTQLFHYCDIDFVREHPYIYLSLNGEDLVFKVSAVFFTDINFDYIAPEPSGQDLRDFFDTVNRKNEYVFDGLAFGEGDKVLTLSTCAHRYDINNTRDQRLVVMAKLLPQGAAVTAVTVTKNPNPERP